MKFRRCALAFLLAVGIRGQVASTVPPAPADVGLVQSEAAPAIVRIRVLEGDGAIQTARTRSAQPIVVVLTDELGRPVPGAAISARLPEEGPTGVFASGMRTEIAVTGPDGRAAIRGITWGAVPGQVSIRITASKREARAGILIVQYITESAGAPAAGRPAADRLPGPGAKSPSAGGRSKWIVLAILAGGAAAGGVTAIAGRGGSHFPGIAPAATQTGPVIGTPAISVGRP